MATISATDAAVDTSDLSTYTFASRSFGAAASDRLIVVAAAWRPVASLASLVSATIGGVSARILRQDSVTRAGTAIIAANVPTSATGDIVLNFDVTLGRCGINVFRGLGLNLATFSTGGASDDGASIPDTTTPVNVSAYAGGAAFGVAVTTAGGTDTAALSWTGTDGLTAEAQQTIEASAGVFTNVMRAGSALTSVTATRAISAFFDVTGAGGLSGYAASTVAIASSGANIAWISA